MRLFTNLVRSFRSHIAHAALTAATAAGCSQPAPAAAPLPPFKALGNVEQLMEGPVAHAAEVFWGSVSTTIDKNGTTEKFPRTDEEWEAVWAAAMTIGESGNLLMMPTRARDGEWNALSAKLVDVGALAINAAESKSPEAVLEAGERVYNVCTECHMKFIPDTGE
jgi:hypothetical protein